MWSGGGATAGKEPESVGVDSVSRVKLMLFIQVNRLEALRGDGEMDHT